MRNRNFTDVFKKSLLLMAIVFSASTFKAQLTGVKNIPGDYTSLDIAIADLNTQGVGLGGVTINLISGNPQTAPAGGYAITATGTIGNPITIVGNANVITASSAQVAGTLSDAIFKIIGGDYIGINTFVMQENPLNTVTAAGTNTMTEWGVALLVASTTDGAQNNEIIGNTISLNLTYSNTFGIYSNVRHTATTPTTLLDISAVTGSNSNNRVYSNLISNVNYGIVFNGSGIGANMDSGNDIGGASASTGNTISNFALSAAASSYVNLTGSNYGIFLNHQLNNNVSFNTLTSSVHASTNTLGGILQNFSVLTPSLPTVATFNNNTVTLSKSAASGGLIGVNYQGISAAIAGSSLSMNNNLVFNCVISGAASSSTLTGVTNLSAVSTLNMNNNVVRSNTSTATTGGFSGVSNSGAVTGNINLNNNEIGNATGGAITYSVATSGALTGISCSGAGASAILNINSNNFQGITYNVASSATNTYIACTAIPASYTANLNTFTNLNINSTGATTFMAMSYTAASTGTKTITNNSIVTGFTRGGASGATLLITDNGSSVNGSLTTVQNNIFSNINLAGTSTITGINLTDGGASPAKIISNNTLSNWTGITGTIIPVNITYLNGVSSLSNNTISNITNQGTITGINIGSTANTATSFTLSTNTITGLSATGVGGNVTGIICANTSPSISILDNSINNLTSTGASSTITGISITGATLTNVQNNVIHTLTGSGITSPIVRGISVSGGTTVNVFRNKIYNVSESAAIATTIGAVSGISLSGGTTVNTNNNVIGNLSAPLANLTDAIRGISVTSTAANAIYNVDYNSIYLNATSAGANFGTTGIFHTGSLTATTGALNLRNNIIINESSVTGTGLTVAFRRATANATNLAATSNKNLLYAGVASSTNLIFTDGTTPQQTMLGYQTSVLPLGHDANSFAGEPFTYGTPGSFFTSLTGSSSDFLRPVAGITTQVESGATAIAGVTTDFAGITRPASGTNPDMGAYEFAGVSPAPVITLNSVTPSTTSQCVAAARTVSVNVTTVSGTITAVNLGYSVNGVPQTNIPMTNTTGTIWEATLPLPTPANALIAWGVSATNSIGLNSSFIGTSYSDEPLTGVTASASTNAATVCANDPSQLMASLTKTGTATIGNGTLLTGAITQPTAFCNRWPSYRMQTVYTAAELNAAGLSAGPITSIAYNITTLGDAATNANYTVLVGTTAVSSFTDFISNAGFTTVFPAVTYTHAVGLNTVTFVTPYNWDGISNLVVEVSHSGADLTNNSQTFYTTTAANTVVWSTSGGLVGTPSNQRLNVIIGGNTPPTITSVTWLDGATTVGTGNPLTVNPATTTTYSANITAAGCIVTPAPTVAVNVNPLPTIPTAANSAQCGTQIPTASVTSTSGLPTPTFKWYDAAVAGTALQNSTSTTYTSNVATTTTFYVAEVNTITGCESPRVAVTVTVATADGILAATTNATICIGSSVTLTAINTNPTPNQSYTYTWTGVAGSGVASVSGSSTIATPTLPGTYTYDLAGVDGGCSAVSSVIVTVNPFEATITPVNATCNAGNDGSFTLGTTSCGTAPYTYSVDGGAYGSIPTNLIAGTYSVLVKDANGYISAALPLIITQPTTTITNPAVTNASVCLNSASALVTASAVTSVPTAASVVVNFTIANQPTELSGSSVPLTVAASPNAIATASMAALPAGAVVTGATLNYNNIVALGNSWQSDVRLGLVGAVTQNYTAGTGTVNNAGTFNYVATIPAGSVNIAGGTITMHYFDFFNDNTAGIESTFPTGTNVASITINYTIPTPATITWWDAPTGGTQIGAGSPFETVGTSILPTTATTGVYTLYAQGQNGACPSPARTEATVTVNALPAVNAGTDQTVCAGTAVTLNGTVAGGTWSGPVAVTNGTAFTPPAGVHTFTYSVTNVAGCTSTDDVVVTVNALPVVNAGVDQTICEGASVTLSGTVAGGTWSGPVTIADGVAFTPPAGVHTFTYSITNVAGCTSTDDVVVTVNTLPTADAGADQTICEGEAVTLSGNPAAGTWTGPVTIADGVAFTPPAGVHTFTYSVTNVAGCTSTDDVVVTVNTLPAVDAGADQTVCEGEAVTLSGTVAGGTWSGPVTIADGVAFTPPAGVHTFTYSVTNAASCTNTDDVIVTVNALPVVNAGVDQTVCEGDAVTLSGTVAGGTWNGPVVIADGVAFTPPAGVHTFTYSVTNVAGCTSTDDVVVTVNTLPTADAGADQTICEGEAVTLSGNPAAGTWTGPVTIADGVAFTPPVGIHTFTYSVTNVAGCTVTNDVIVTVNALPTADAGTDLAVCDGEEVTLNGTGGTSPTWTGPVAVTNGTPVVLPVGVHVFNLTITGSNGCTDTDAIQVTVNALPTAVATDNLDATITASAGTTYQWIDCATNLPIAGATAQTYTVTANGSYAVIVNNGTCEDTSDCVVIDYIGINEVSQDMISVFPNPTRDFVTVNMTAANASIEVVDAQGKILQTSIVENGGTLSLASYETGMYIFRITTENGTSIHRISKN